MRHTIIIGGGAAGMAAAIAAAERGDRVTVLERGRKPLKKLGVTGNGRGNLLNCGQPEFYGDVDFALEVLRHMPYEKIAAFLNDAGIPLVHEEAGRMYPSSFLASSAVDALKLRAQELGVSVNINTRAVHIIRKEKSFSVRCLRSIYGEDTMRKNGRVKPGELIGEEPCEYTGDRVIVTVGGAAAPMHGTDGTAYTLLSEHGHTLAPIRPALCALVTDKAPLEGLSGQRVRAHLTLLDKDGQPLCESAGEALFADDGVSGIAAMQLSRFAHDGCTLMMDLRVAVSGDADADMEKWLIQRAGRVSDAKHLLTGACTPQLANALWRMSGDRASLSPEALCALAGAIRHYRIPVRGTRGFDSAQVTAGGIRTADFDAAAMESRLCPGLYAAGEVLDVDGGCGGHNLMFAFASGLLAGMA